MEPSAERHRSTPGEMRGTSCPRYGQVPSPIEGPSSTLQLTGIRVFMKGSQAKRVSGHQGQPPPGVQVRCSYSGVAGHPSQGRPELRPNSHSQPIYKAPQAKVSLVLCSTFPRSEDGNAPREKTNNKCWGETTTRSWRCHQSNGGDTENFSITEWGSSEQTCPQHKTPAGAALCNSILGKELRLRPLTLSKGHGPERF